MGIANPWPLQFGRITMGIDREERIRHRAYSIWEERGRPHGEDFTHWQQASDEYENAGLWDIAVPDDISVLGEDDPGKTLAKRKAAPAKRQRK
jgi:hypothetical protein